jgi:hypothetical protein
MRIKLKISVIVFGCLAIAACKPKGSVCAINMDDFLKTYQLQVYKADSTNKNSAYRDIAIDSIVGGYYAFYPNGYLKEYRFYINRDTFNYKEQYDSSGHFRKSLGNPLVHKGAALSGNSLIMRLYFLDLNWEYDSVDIQLKDSSRINLSLVNDSVYTNMRVAYYTFDSLTADKKIQAYLRVKYKNKCTGEVTKLTDSINLTYTPM